MSQNEDIFEIVHNENTDKSEEEPFFTIDLLDQDQPAATDKSTQVSPYSTDTFEISLSSESESESEYESKPLYYFNFVYQKEPVCSICSEKFETEAKVSVLVCGHLFHQSCFHEWLDYHNSCPLCRIEVIMDQ